MVTCFREGCSKRGAKRCSGCMQAVYCARSCQKACWPTHKYQCNYQSRKDADETDADEREPPAKPSGTECTACGVRYSVWNPRDQICRDCGYNTCYECACHRQKGSCYCEESNFGWRYCEREPRPYHSSSRTGKAYDGDYHPGVEDTKYGPEVRPDLYEDLPRRCTGCGQWRLCLKKGSAQWYKDTYHIETTEDREKRQPAVESFLHVMQDFQKRAEAAERERERERAANAAEEPPSGGCIII